MVKRVKMVWRSKCHWVQMVQTVHLVGVMANELEIVGLIGVGLFVLTEFEYDE